MVFIHACLLFVVFCVLFSIGTINLPCPALELIGSVICSVRLRTLPWGTFTTASLYVFMHNYTLMQGISANFLVPLSSVFIANK